MVSRLLLDLDNTVYSETYGLERDVMRRMTEYTSRILGLSTEETIERRRSRTALYGTTLEWLMCEYGFSDVESYFAAIHPEGEEEPLSPDPALGRLLDSIDLPKAIFTNAPREHAERILSRLGVADRFDAIYDIRFNGLKGKPHAEAIRRVCAACGVDTSEAIFVDDLPRYVRGFIEAGGRGILIDELDRHPDTRLERIFSLVELPAIISAAKGEDGQLGLFE
jgi:putative hydrolase of the HAD superfamily